MSAAAVCLLYFAANARADVADNAEDAAYCAECARQWAAAILSGDA